MHMQFPLCCVERTVDLRAAKGRDGREESTAAAGVRCG